MRHWVQAQLRSNWIEVFAIPIIASIMDTQPIFVLLIFLSPVFAGGTVGVSFLNEISIILLALGLRWWAMVIHWRVARHGMSEQNERLLRVLGLLGAGGLVIGTPVLLIRTVVSLILASALVLWFWWRGMRETMVLSDEQLVSSFRIGFIVLIIILIFAVFYLDTTYAVLFTTLAQAIPIFFLSGLLGLSFTRIGLVRRESMRYTPDTPALGSTRNWLFALTCFWLAVVVAVLALELFSFQTVIAFMSLLWASITTILVWLVTLIGYLITPILYVIGLVFLFLIRTFHMSGAGIVNPAYPAPRRNPIGHPQDFSPETLQAGRFILLSLSLLILFFVARTLLRRLRTRRKKEDDVEEIREGLSLRFLAQQRRDERPQRLTQSAYPQLDVLDPDTARAHYRDLLQTMALNNPALTRRSEETPSEYQARLLAFAKQTLFSDVQSAQGEEETPPSDQTILAILTHNYSVERYGGEQLDQVQQGYLRTWVPRLLAHLTGAETR